MAKKLDALRKAQAELGQTSIARNKPKSEVDPNAVEPKPAPKKPTADIEAKHQWAQMNFTVNEDLKWEIAEWCSRHRMKRNQFLAEAFELMKQSKGVQLCITYYFVIHNIS